MREALRSYRVNHRQICALHDDIHLLVRLVTSAVLFEENKTEFFEKEILPILDRLLSILLHIYEGSGGKWRKISSKKISKSLQSVGPLFHSDIAAAFDNDPATCDPLEVVLCYPGCKSVRYYRISHIFYRHQIPLLPRMIAELSHESSGIDIHPGAQIGSHFFIDHGTGVVIGETAVIGKHVTLYQGVTLGAKRIPRDDSGAPIRGEIRHPTIEDGVVIYSGATILGHICIGKKSVVGGNVWLTESVPPYSRVTQQRYLSSSFSHGDGI